MFPIAFPQGTVSRTLHDDDIAGISDLSRTPACETTGSISGTVTEDGQGVCGRISWRSTRERNNGRRILARLAGTFRDGQSVPGFYVLRVGRSARDTDSFLGVVDVDFRVGTRLIVVPRRIGQQDGECSGCEEVSGATNGCWVPVLGAGCGAGCRVRGAGCCCDCVCADAGAEKTSALACDGPAARRSRRWAPRKRHRAGRHFPSSRVKRGLSRLPVSTAGLACASPGGFISRRPRHMPDRI